MMKHGIILVFCLVAHAGSQAQSILSEQLVSEQLIRMPVSEQKMSSQYEGSPYLYDTFMTSILSMEGNGRFKLPMRYNMYRDIIEVKHRGREMQILPNDLIHNIKINEHTLVIGDYELEKKKTRGFLFLLDSGEVSLLEKKNITFEEWRPARAQEAGPRSATFKASLDNFFIRSKNKITPITSLKELANLFPHHRSQVADYIKMHKIKLKEAKLVELFQYFNTTWTQASSQPKS